MRSAILSGISATFLLFASHAGAAAETRLTFATVNPSNAHLTVQYFKPWVQAINDDGKGVVQIDVVDGYTLANLRNVYDRINADVAQIGWVVGGALGKKLSKANILSLPFSTGNAEIASVALWRIYDKGVISDQFDPIKPLVVCAFPQQLVHTSSKKVTRLEDLEGMKIRVSGRVATQVAKALGAAPISLNATEIYQGLQRGTVDGTFTQWTTFQPFKLAEVTKYHLEVPLSSGPGFIFMNSKKYASLPADARAVLDRHSGEAASRAFGKFWDEAQAAGRASVADMKDHVIETISPEELTRWKGRIEPVIAQWIQEIPDGLNVRRAYEAELSKIQDGK